MAKEKREHVMMVCSESGDINYYTSRNRLGAKLELMKYNPYLRRHTLHRELKK